MPSSCVCHHLTQTLECPCSTKAEAASIYVNRTMVYWFSSTCKTQFSQWKQNPDSRARNCIKSKKKKHFARNTFF